MKRLREASALLETIKLSEGKLASLEAKLRLDELLGELDYYYELMTLTGRNELKENYSSELSKINGVWCVW